MTIREPYRIRPGHEARSVGRPSRRPAALALAVIMVLAAALHAYWTAGGMWLLPTVVNTPPDKVPPDIVSGPILVITLALSAGMLLVAFLGLGRAYWVRRSWIQKLSAVGLGIFSLLMLASAGFHILGPRDLGRFVFAPIFLVLGGLGAYLAWPRRRGSRPAASARAKRRDSKPSVKRVARSAAWVAACLVAAAVLFQYVYLPWNLSWGATEEEANREMAGDELCGDADFSPTRAITIDASPEEVWPWIVQMGYKRAGFYSYDALDNAGVPSADRIIPELQDVKLGDRIPLDRAGSVVVKALEAHRVFVLASEPPFLTWAWELSEAGPRRTRVVTRVRAQMGDAQMKFVWEAFEFFMIRKCLLGIKRRAESSGV